MKLAIGHDICEGMLEAAGRAAPLEACGLLGGVEDHATAFYELTNTDESGEHYTMAPQEQFAAIKDMRGKGIRMLAIWHSHPETPARMSDEDLRLAYTPGVAYVIVSLATPGRPDIRAYAADEGPPAEIALTIAPSSLEESETS